MNKEAVMEDEIKKTLLSLIDENEIIKLIKDLVYSPSHEGVMNQETATAEKIRLFLQAAGIEAHLVPVLDGRCNIIARIKGQGGGKSLLLTGHTDTVAPFDMEYPYEARIIDGALYGRGTVDMKGALACMVAAMAAIQKAGITLRGDLYFAGVIDEESCSKGTQALLDGGFVADGAIIGEPTGMKICACHKGVEWFEIFFHGKAVHTARQEEGINAIQKAGKCIAEIEERLIPQLDKRIHPLIGKSTLNYGFINGGTQPSTVAGKCILQIGRRWIPQEKYEDVLRDFENLLTAIRKKDPDFIAEFHPMEDETEEATDVSENLHHEAMETDIRDPIVVTAQKVLNGFGSGRDKLCAFDAWSDGGIISSYGRIPCIVLGPGNIESAHSPQEHLEIDTIREAALIYGLIACEFCARA